MYKDGLHIALCLIASVLLICLSFKYSEVKSDYDKLKKEYDYVVEYLNNTNEDLDECMNTCKTD